MKESKAVYVTKRDIKVELNREYHYFTNNITRDRDYSPLSLRYDQKTQEVGCQYDCKRDNLICTCRNLATLRKRQEVRYFGLPNQIYTYQRSRSFADIGVGSVKKLQRKKVKKIYLPETDDRGVGSSDLSSFFIGRTRPLRAGYYYESKRTSSKCVGGILEYNTGCVMNKKLSPIVQTTTGSTSPRDSILNRNIEIGSNTAVKSLTNTTTQVEDHFKKEVEVKSELNVEEVNPVIIIQEDIKDMKTRPVDTNNITEKNDQNSDKAYSSDSLVQHVHNLENPSDDRQSHLSMDVEDPMENKLEREYRRIFATKSKSKEAKPSIDKPLPDFKSTSTLRRRFEALRRGLAKKEDSKRNAVIVSKVSSQVSAASRKDVSINSDPPSLEGRSFSNTKTYSPFPQIHSRDKSIYNPRTSHYRRSVTGKKDRGSAQWSSRCHVDDDDFSESQGVKGMFKLWGKKFNLEDDNYKRRATPKPSYASSKRTDKRVEEPKLVIKSEIEEKKEGRKFFFFKKKHKDHKDKSYKTKKGVTAGRCEVKEGLMIKVCGANSYEPEDLIPEPEVLPDDYEDMVRKAWLKKFLSQAIESRNSVQVRWNNKTYAPSSSTVFELMDNVYRDTGVIFRSKSQVTVQPSYKSYTKQHVNFVQQNIEAWMIPKTITDRSKVIPTKIKCKSNEERKDNIEVRISDQKWFIDKSKAFSHKIEVVLHSKNFKKLNKEESSEYLRIDIPKGFFVDSSSDERNDKQPANQSSDEEVYKIVEYETGSDLKKEIAVKNLDTGDHKQNNIQVTVSVKESKDSDKILETVIKRPPGNRDVVIQGSNVYIPKRCDVIGVGIITQRDLREIQKPILKIQDDYSDEESEHNILKPNQKKCEFAESYLQDYYRNWTPLGIDLCSWCVSDSKVRCYSENQGDGTKSCPNIFEDFQAATVLSSCGTSSCSHCHTRVEAKKSSEKCKWFGKLRKKGKDNQAKNMEKRVHPKDSLEVFKRRKIYAASMKSKWGTVCPDIEEPCPVPVPCCEREPVPNTLIECPKLMKSCCKPIETKPKKRATKKHVSLPDCDTMNELLAKQLTDSLPEGILAFKGASVSCEMCKKKGGCCKKHAKVNSQLSCEIPRAPCRDSCEQMKKPPCSDSKVSCEKPPSCPPTPPCPPSPPCRSPSCPSTPVKKITYSSSCPPSPPKCPPSPPPCKKSTPCPTPPCKKPPPSPPPPCPPSPPCKNRPIPCPASPPPCKKPPSCPPSPPPCKKPPSCPPSPPPCKEPPPCPPSPPPCKQPPPCPPSPPPSRKPPACPPSPPPCKQPPPCPPSPPPCRKPPSCPPSPPPCRKPPSCPPSPPPCRKKPPCPPSPPPCRKISTAPPSTPPCRRPPPCPPAPPPCKKPLPCPPPPPRCSPSCPHIPHPSPKPSCPHTPPCPPSPPPCPYASPPPCRRPPPRRPKPPSCPHSPPCTPPPPPCPPKPPSCPHSPPCTPPPPPCPPKPPPCPPKPPSCPHSPPCTPPPPPCPPKPPSCPHSPPCTPPPPPCPPKPPSCPYSPPCAPPPPPPCRPKPPSCPHSPPCTPPPPPCYRSSKPCPAAPPSCPSSPQSCCSRDPTLCPSLPAPCKKASSGFCKKLFKKKPMCPASPPCKPTPCKQSYCKALNCQPSPCQLANQKFSTSSISYTSITNAPDAPFCYSPIHPCPPEKPKKKETPCNSSPCYTQNSRYQTSTLEKPHSVFTEPHCDQCRTETEDNFPWPTKNQVSNQSSRTSLNQIEEVYLNTSGEPAQQEICPVLKPSDSGKCKKDCPLLPKLSCETIPSPKNECKKSCPNKQSPPPCNMPEMQCPPPKPCSSPQPNSSPVKKPFKYGSSKTSGLFLKMKPKKSTCSKDCLAWGGDGNDDDDDGCISLNSQEKITIRLKKDTASTEEIREGLNIKVQDEDGMTLFERKDYRLQHADCSMHGPSLLGDMYKASEVRRVTTNDSVQCLGIDTDDRKDIVEGKSDASIANLIEIQFKLKVTQGEKTTEINIANNGEKEANREDHNTETKEAINKIPQEVFIVKNEGERPAENSDQKNDINIRIVIKNFKPKSGKKKSANAHNDDYSKHFSKQISAKFNTVSTGYSDVLHDDNVFSVHRATVDLTSSVDKSKTHSNRSEEIMSEPLVERGRGNLIGSDQSICRCITDMSEGKSEDAEVKSVPSQKYSVTKETQDNPEETDTEKLTDHKYEYTEETDTEKPIDHKYDTEGTDTDKQVEPKYDTEETDTDKRVDRKYDTFMSTDTDEPDAMPEQDTYNLEKPKSIEVIVKPHTKEEKKEMLKLVFEKAHETKTKNKTRMRKLRDMLKVILTSDSSDHDDTKLLNNDLAKDVTYASLKPNYFRDSDSMNNYYKTESNPILSDIEINSQVVYPTVQNNSECSNSNPSEVLSSENESPDRRCMCTTLAARLKLASRIGEGGGCCCGTKVSIKKNEETICDLNKESDYFQYDLKPVEYVDVETQHSRFLTNKINSTNLSIHKSMKCNIIGNITKQQEMITDSGVINVDDRNFNCLKRNLAPSLKECEMRKLNRNTILSISDEDKIVVLSGNTNQCSVDCGKAKENKRNDPTDLVRASDILQSYETKKAVLEIYTEKTISDEGERLVAKLPKFVYDRENEIQTNYEAMATNTYKAVCKRNIVMMAINR